MTDVVRQARDGEVRVGKRLARRFGGTLNATDAIGASTDRPANVAALLRNKHVEAGIAIAADYPTDAPTAG